MIRDVEIYNIETKQTFLAQKISHDPDNTTYTIGLSEEVLTGDPDIAWESICFIKETGEMWAGGKLYYCKEPDSKSLVLGEGIKKTVGTDAIEIAIDPEYLKTFIEEYINDFVDRNWENEDDLLSKQYDVLAQCINYTIDDSKYNWYNFDNIVSNIIIFDEPDATVPSGTPNFIDKYVPSFTMSLKKPLNLEITPYINLQYFTLNACPLNFRFIDANGNCSTPIICGRRENDGSSSSTIVIDTDSNQSNTTLKISSLGSAGYTDQKTLSGIDTYVTNTLIPEYTKNGHYTESKVGKAEVINILTDLESGFTTHEDTGFDKTNIVALRVQLVETWDKAQITYKERHKAFIFNKFEFTDEKI